MASILLVEKMNLKQKFTKKELKKIPTVYKDFAITIDEKEEIISD